MKNLTAVLALAVLICSCGTAKSDAPIDPDIIPAGPAHWVRVEHEIRLDSLAGPRLVLPYGAPGAVNGSPTPGASAAKAAVTGYRVAFKPDPLDRDDRCGLAVLALILVHGDGGTEEIPATGHVVDNSDGLKGLRVEASKLDRKNLVIPAGASAQVVFDAPVVVHGPAAAPPPANR